MGILQTVGREHVPFDPSNSVHRAAFWLLRSTGRQDERLRFVVEEGYTSVMTMMADKIACHYAKPKAVKEKQVAMPLPRKVTLMGRR